MILAGLHQQLGVRYRAIKGIAFRTFGELEDAEKELSAARDEYAVQGRQLQVAITALDLACVCAARGHYDEVKNLAAGAYAVFVREGVGKETLRALPPRTGATLFVEELSKRVAPSVPGLW